MGSYLSKGARTRQITVQKEPIPGREMVKNAAGGFVFEISALERLRRFLILGVEGGTYYARQSPLIASSTDALRQALEEQPARVIDLLVEVSMKGLAFKQDQVIFALATAAASKDKETAIYALRQLPVICRTGSHLFLFAGFVNERRGWGLTLRKGVAAWYQNPDVDALAFQMVKYRERHGFTHKRLIDLSHPVPPTLEHELLYRWAVGYDPVLVHRTVDQFKWAQLAQTPADTVAVINQAKRPIPQEFLKSEHTNDPAVWRAMIDRGVPTGALLRNLGRLTSYGVLKPFDASVARVAGQLRSQSALLGARVHPVAVLNALLTYRSGRGESRTWRPVQQVSDALEDAFYVSFGAVSPADRRMLLAVDVSGSMTHENCMGVRLLDARTAAAAMALVSAASEPNHHIVAFSSNRTVGNQMGVPDPEFWDPHDPSSWRLAPLDVSPRQRLADVVETMRRTPAGATDCAMPMTYAIEQQLEVDCFVIYTDMESWSGRVHPAQALQRYRRESGIDARLVAVAMTATRYSVADPADRGMLDVVGFDLNAPRMIRTFARGEM